MSDVEPDYVRISRAAKGVSWTFSLSRHQHEAPEFWVKRVVDLHELLKERLGAEPGYEGQKDGKS